MFFEICIRICASGKDFCVHWWNLADLAVMILCVLATLYYLLMHNIVGVHEEAEEAIMADEVLISLRSSMHVARLALFVKNKRSMDSAAHSSVEFSVLSAESDADTDDDRLVT